MGEYNNRRTAGNGASLERKLANAKRKRKKKRIRLIKRIVAIVIVVAIIVTGAFFGIKACNSNGSKTVAQTSGGGTTQKNLDGYPSLSMNYKYLQNDNINSKYAVVLDSENHTIVAGKNSYDRIYPASMTKLMTLIVAVENITDYSQSYTFGRVLLDYLYRQDASVAGYELGEIGYAEDFLYGLILPSGADAAYALTSMAAPSDEEFVNLMNKKVQELGLKDTHFSNPTGLHDENNYTTPVDMALVLDYAMKNEKCREVLAATYYKIAPNNVHQYGFTIYSLVYRRFAQTDVKLNEGITILGGKTGFEDAAGNCLASCATKDGHMYITITAMAETNLAPENDHVIIYNDYVE